MKHACFCEIPGSRTPLRDPVNTNVAGYCLQSPSAIQGLMAGREVTIWRPRMDMQSTSAAAFTAHELPRCAPALAPPPLQAPPPMDCLSSYQASLSCCW